MSPDLQRALALAKDLPLEALPAFLGELEIVRVTAFARITAPAAEAKPDERIDIHEAARRLGVSAAYLYRHHGQMKFAQREGRKLVFSSAGLAQYLKRAR